VAWISVTAVGNEAFALITVTVSVRKSSKQQTHVVLQVTGLIAHYNNSVMQTTACSRKYYSNASRSTRFCVLHMFLVLYSYK
jgi:hypothetical protein